MRYYGFGRYVSVTEKRAKALKKIEQLKKKNPGIRPVIIEGRTLAKSFWAKSWNKNLERYADYENRIGRGRSYVRHRAVLDLSIDKGKIRSLVQGSGRSPYKVTIRIGAVLPKTWKGVTAACSGKIDSLPELLDGKFTKGLGEILMEKGRGLFPTPKEISFDCSCPDRASMCKHVAATLYGVGARIDEDPSLFFLLRGVDMQELITSAMAETTRDLLDKAGSGDRKVVETEDLSALFGIEMEEVFSVPDKKTKGGRPKAPAAKKRAAKAAAPQKNKAVSAGKPSPAKRRKTAATGHEAPATPSAKKGAVRTSTTSGKKEGVGTSSVSKYEAKRASSGAGKRGMKSPFDTVVSVIRRRRVKGIGVAEIRERTGLPETQIRNAIYRANSKGLIVSQARGLYIKGPNAPD